MVAPSHDQVGFITLHDEGGLLTSVKELPYEVSALAWG